MLDQLTPEQANELFIYAGIEPFGEERQDLRAAHLLKFYYDTKRGKKGTDLELGEFCLYKDLAEGARDRRVSSDLMAIMHKHERKQGG